MQAEDLQLGALGDLRGAFDGHLLRENREKQTGPGQRCPIARKPKTIMVPNGSR